MVKFLVILRQHKLLTKVRRWLSKQSSDHLVFGLLAGLPKIMEFDTGFFGQQGDVEFEIRNLAKAVPGTAVVC